VITEGFTSRRHAAAVAVACLHLAIVLCGALRVSPVPENSAVGSALETYGAYTGANNAYGFFAPAVASEWRATFSICVDEQNCIPVAEEEVNREASLLFVTIDGLFAYEEVRDLVAASWAAAQFARFPHAKLVIVKAGAFVVPTMAQARAGRKPHWEDIYAFAFTRADVRQR
jgi:hypothetical protein